MAHLRSWNSSVAYARRAAALWLAFLAAACQDGLLHTPAAGKTSVVIAYMKSAALAIGQADPDRVHIRVSRTTNVLYDSTLVFAPSSNEVRVRVDLEVQQESETVDVVVELLEANVVISRGAQSVTVKKGEVTSASILADNVADNLTVADHFACYLNPAGEAYCWGRNDFSQLGSGTSIGSSRPVAVAGGHRFVSIDAGLVHTCALAEGGEAWCWGTNTWGQLGDGTNTHANIPVAVSGGLRFRKVSAGFFHTCGLTMAGDLYCWGQNNFNQLGITGPNTNVPVRAGGNIRFDDVEAGFLDNCGLSAGATYCWGRPTGMGSFQPVATPTLVAGADGLRSVSVGTTHTCGIANNGATRCWGGVNYEFGQLGHGSTAASLIPVAVVGGHNFVTVSTSRANSAFVGYTCGLTIDGLAYCWGLNRVGQLGSSTASATCLSQVLPNAPLPCSPVPVPVSGGIRFSSIEIGNEHGCGLARDGRVYCWGAGFAGALGNGSLSDSPIPVAAGAPIAAPAIASLQLNARTLNLVVGDTTSISPVVNDQHGLPIFVPVTWSSSDTTRLRIETFPLRPTVSGTRDRVLRALAPGTVSVTAVAAGKSVSVNVVIATPNIPSLRPQPHSAQVPLAESHATNLEIIKRHQP